ncbi:MAG: hypothetical protein ABUR63_05800 [Verrucomicrobiota bacterium]
MRLKTLPLVLATLALGTVGPKPSVANACSLALNAIYRRDVLPPTGSVGVPTNVQLWVSYRGTFDATGSTLNGQAFSPPAAADLTLKSMNGASISLAATAVVSTSSESLIRLQPNAPLQPNTTYQILDRIVSVSCTSDCALGDPKVFASFTTGAGEDHLAPTFAGVSVAAPFGTPYECTSSSCCGPFVRATFRLSWSPGTDAVAGDTLIYKVYQVQSGGGLGASKLLFGSVNGREGGIITDERSVICSGVAFGAPDPVFFGPFIVHAMDWAGNEDTNQTAMSIDDLCVKVTTGAGGGGGSGGAGTGGTTPTSGSAAGSGGSVSPAAMGGGGGCSVAAPARVADLPWAVFLVVALMGGVGRRRRAGTDRR